MTTTDPTLAARLDYLCSRYVTTQDTPLMWEAERIMFHAYCSGQLITTAEADARVKAAVVAEREACATWHDREASAAMNSLHCGSENSEYRAANRLHDLHTASAAAIRARGEPL